MLEHRVAVGSELGEDALEIRPHRGVGVFLHDQARRRVTDEDGEQPVMRLDLREEALKPLRDGAIPIVPGDPDKSAIVQRIFAHVERLERVVHRGGGAPPLDHEHVGARDRDVGHEAG